MRQRKVATRSAGVSGPPSVVKPRPEGKRTTNATAPQGSAGFEVGSPEAGARIVFHCLPCDHEADATYKRGRSGLLEWQIGSHNRIRCPGGGECLRSIADWLAAPSGGALKLDPRPWLSQVAEYVGHRGGEPEPLPSSSLIDGWHSRLLSTEAALDYVTRERGLTLATIARHRLGWDGDEHAITLPVRNATGQLVNLRRRRLGPREPFRGLRDRGSQLYPDLPRGGVLLVAGEFDALVARQHGAGYVVTTTCGASLPDHLAAELAGRSVGVAYDVGEEAAAEQTVAKLRALGSDSWLVRLALLGLPPGGDLNDHYRNGGTTGALANLIRRKKGGRES